MNDSPIRENAFQKQGLFVLELVNEVRSHMDRMRADTAALEALNAPVWRDLEATAHNVAARAEVLKLPVLQQGARELEQLAIAILARDAGDKQAHIEAAMVGIEMLALELDALEKDLGEP